MTQVENRVELEQRKQDACTAFLDAEAALKADERERDREKLKTVRAELRKARGEYETLRRAVKVAETRLAARGRTADISRAVTRHAAPER